MRFAHTVVSEVGFRDPGHTARRYELAHELLRRLADENVDIAFLPAGYFAEREEAHLTGSAICLDDLTNLHGVQAVAGMDVIDPTLLDAAEVADLVRQRRLPSFAYAGQTHRGPWRQTSVTNADAELTPEEDLPGLGRVIDVRGRKVGVLLCGELFSWRARESIAEAGPDLVVDLGHARMGQGLIPAMRRLAADAGCPVAHAQHLAGWYGRSIHYVGADGVRQSAPTDDCRWVGDDDFWIAWVTRSI